MVEYLLLKLLTSSGFFGRFGMKQYNWVSLGCGVIANQLAQAIEKAVSGTADEMHLDYTTDVMSIMTDIRRKWGFLYPEEKETEWEQV